MSAHVAADDGRPGRAAREDAGENVAWKPRVVAFFCNWCTYTAADLAGVSRLKHSPHFRIIRVMCSGRVDPQFVLEAYARGADAVLIGGCHPGDCHYMEGNYKCLRRFHLMQRMLKQMGIEKERFRLEWISASEGARVKTVVNDLVEKVEALGPLALPDRFRDWDREVDRLEAEVSAGGAAPDGAREEAASHAR
jgi:F420-non-reducing hydrogenase iron-sulfur subunit